MELIVFEHPDCTYCRAFRQNIGPTYPHSVPAAEAPLRYVDIAKSDIGGLHLSERIDTLPTAVVMRNGREVDRIVGYWGPTGLFQLLSHILAKME